MDSKKTYTLHVNALEIKAEYYEEDIKEIFIPLLEDMTRLKREKNGRVLVYMAASPGVGKTTLTLFLEYLAKNNENLEEIQAIGLDGFHYSQKYLDTHTTLRDGKPVSMADIKGAAETYDLLKLKRKIKELKKQDVLWPVYDRKLHDVVDDQTLVSGDIVLLEGNWLLLKDKGWNELIDECDYSIFIQADQQMLKERLIDRKVKGGSSYEDAAAWYEKSDGVNVVRVLNDSMDADLKLELLDDGKYIKK